MRSFLGAIAAYDREITTLRLRNARTAKAKRGGYAHGAPPYGWTGSGGKLHKVPAEQATLARLLALRAAGGSTRTIAATLNAEGHTTKRSGTWTSPVVSRILARTEHRPVTAAQQRNAKVEVSK
jgi:DNA invertase Pin-like site-specific DNA recombinase